MSTRRDISKIVLDKLGVVGEGEPIAPEDLRTVEDAIDLEFETYRELGWVWWYNVDCTPEAATRPFAYAMAGEVHEEFGIDGNEIARIERLAAKGRARLHELQAANDQGEPIPSSYF